MPIIAVGRKDLDVDELRARAKESISKSGSFDAAAFAKLAALIRYVKVDYDDAATFSAIKDALGSAKHPLRTTWSPSPPEVFEQVATNLAKAGLNVRGRASRSRSPSAAMRASAKALSAALHRHFPEEAIFRIDHYIGKESVENLIYFRAANPLIEASFRPRLRAEHRDHDGRVVRREGPRQVLRRGRRRARRRAESPPRSHRVHRDGDPGREGPPGPSCAERSQACSRRFALLSAADIVRGQARGY